MKNILLPIIGLGISLVVGFACFLLWFVRMYFSLRGAGSLIDPESNGIINFGMAVLFIPVLLIAPVRFMQKKEKFIAIGAVIPVLIWILFLYGLGSIVFDKSNYYTPFDKKRWMQSGGKPVRMARELVRSKALIGLTPSEVTERLGEGILSVDGKKITYMTSQGQGLRLILTINDNQITDAALYTEDYDFVFWYTKMTTYGNSIFYAEYDGLMHTDYLSLYDNGVFKIDLAGLESNGTYRINGDTIFLDHYKFNGNSCRAFVIENNGLYELENIDNVWMRSYADTYMGINNITIQE